MTSIRPALFLRQKPILLLVALFIAWKTLLTLTVLGSPGPGYDTSGTLLKVCGKRIINGPVFEKVDTVVRPRLLKFVRWDAIFYTEIARRDRLYEQEWAFGLGFTKLLGAILFGMKKTRFAPDCFGEATAGIGLSHAAHLLSVLFLYALSKCIFQAEGEKTSSVPFITAALHIISPAGVFLSAPYSEGLFSLLNVGGLYLYNASLQRTYEDVQLHHLVGTAAAGLTFGLATSVRSNGILSGVPFLYDASLVALHIRSHGFSSKALRTLLALAFGGSLIALGAILPQIMAYRSYCQAGDIGKRPSWCFRPIPSIYAWVQSHYWDTGLFHYWTVSNLPLFLLATPCLWLLYRSAVWTLRPAEDFNDLSSKNGGGYRRTVALVQELRRMAMPQVILAALALTSYHVQIITRLSSGYPLWSIWLASKLCGRQREELNFQPRVRITILIRWMVMYAFIQAGLYASFLPPA